MFKFDISIYPKAQSGSGTKAQSEKQNVTFQPFYLSIFPLVPAPQHHCSAFPVSEYIALIRVH